MKQCQIMDELDKYNLLYECINGDKGKLSEIRLDLDFEGFGECEILVANYNGKGVCNCFTKYNAFNVKFTNFSKYTYCVHTDFNKYTFDKIHIEKSDNVVIIHCSNGYSTMCIRYSK